MFGETIYVKNAVITRDSLGDEVESFDTDDPTSWVPCEHVGVEPVKSSELEEAGRDSTKETFRLYFKFGRATNANITITSKSRIRVRGIDCSVYGTVEDWINSPLSGRSAGRVVEVNRMGG